MTTCGVPLGPSGPQDHAWAGGVRKIRFRFRKNRKTGKKQVTYQIKALDKLVTVGTTNSGFPDYSSGKYGKRDLRIIAWTKGAQ